VRLWRCTATIAVVIASDSEPHYLDVSDEMIEEVRDQGSALFESALVSEIKTRKDVPDGWIEAIPRGDGCDMTVAKILKAGEESGE